MKFKKTKNSYILVCSKTSLDCILTKSGKTVSKPNQLKTAKERS